MRTGALSFKREAASAQASPARIIKKQRICPVEKQRAGCTSAGGRLVFTSWIG